MAWLSSYRSYPPAVILTPDVTAPAVPPQPTLLYQPNGNTSGGSYLIAWPPSVDPVVPGAVTSGTKEYIVSVSGTTQSPISDTAAIAAPLVSVIGVNNGGSPITGSDTGTVLTATSSTGDTFAQHFGTSDEFIYTKSLARGPCVVAMRITAETVVGSFSKRGVEMRASPAANAAYVNLLSFGPATGGKGEQRASAGASATGGAIFSLPAYPFWVRLWMDSNGLVTRDYSTDSVTGALGDGTWTVYDTITPAFGPAFYVGRFADPETASSGVGGTTSCTFDRYYTSGLAGLTFAGSGTTGSTLALSAAARDNALNLSVQGPSLVVTFTASALPTPYYTKYAIGGSTISTYRYDNTPFQTYAKNLSAVILNYLFATDQSATQTQAQIDQAIASSTIGTLPIHYSNTFYIFAANNPASLNTACTSGNFLLRSAFPSGGVMAGSQSGSTIYNMNPGGPTFNGRTAAQYLPAFLLDWHVKGGADGICGGVHSPNAFCKGFFLDDWQPFAPGDSHGDWLRLGTLSGNDFTYNSTTNGNVAQAIQAGYVSMINALKSNSSGTFNVGGNGGGSPSDFTLPTPASYIGFSNNIVFENPVGGGRGCIGNPGNGGSFGSLLAAYQKKQATVAPGGVLDFNASNVRADGSVMQSYQVSTNGPPVYSPPWQGVRAYWGLCNVLGDGGFDPDGTDPFGDSGNGAPHSSSILRWFDWFQINTVTGVAYSQANANLGVNWIGGWVDPPQTVKWQSVGPLGIWRRRGVNADIFINPYGNGAQVNVPLGQTYRKVTSAQDPTMNGGTISSWSPADGGCGDCLIALH